MTCKMGTVEVEGNQWVGTGWKESIKGDDYYPNISHELVYINVRKDNNESH
jgi:hypothetical protein